MFLSVTQAGYCRLETSIDMPLFDWFKIFSRSKLTPLESRVMKTVSTKLSPAAKQLFDAQLNQFNLIQRHASGKEADFYVMRRGKPFMEERFRFPLRSEALLATIELISNIGQESLRAEVWIVNGGVFSLIFNKPPKNISEQSMYIAKINIQCDPMTPASEKVIANVQRREQILSMINARLPDEYLLMVGEENGKSVNDWAVSGIKNIRKIVQRNGNYYILAEKQEMGVIGIKEDDWSGQLYYLDYEDDRSERITVSMRKFLEEYDVGKVIGRF